MCRTRLQNGIVPARGRRNIRPHHAFSGGGGCCRPPAASRRLGSAGFCGLLTPGSWPSRNGHFGALESCGNAAPGGPVGGLPPGPVFPGSTSRKNLQQSTRILPPGPLRAAQAVVSAFGQSVHVVSAFGQRFSLKREKALAKSAHNRRQLVKSALNALLLPRVSPAPGRQHRHARSRVCAASPSTRALLLPRSL